ncbi:hypothetical protein BV22DRAFT_1135885 [Leucogyrophana mollusca]|uniref:Uncharacterized protein n=1 Tax=Leucogyrophana mollusca TaxID=85980 RepID=A0ACB8AUM1_9AGAM|nr:hypothetical protein BV22DRAFT_1135885 [Leucogyrophana mollusca]
MHTECGSSQAENVALREEIDALERYLLQSLSVVLLTPRRCPRSPPHVLHHLLDVTFNQGGDKAPSYNSHKDLSSSSRLGLHTSFLGGLGLGVTHSHDIHPTLAVSSAVLVGAASVLGSSGVSLSVLGDVLTGELMQNTHTTKTKT